MAGLVGGLVLAACSTAEGPTPDDAQAVAPGAPGAAATWSNAEKVAIGSSYEAYDAGGQYSAASPTAPISKVWFSMTKDRITEVMWGLIHEAQIREIRFLVVGPDGIIPADTHTVVPYVGDDGRPSAPASELVATGDGFQLRQLVFTDPDSDTLLVNLRAELQRDDLRVYAYIDPALANTGSGDFATVRDGALHAFEGDSHLVVRARDRVDEALSVGFVGASDGLGELNAGYAETLYASTGAVPGNVGMLMEVPLSGGAIAGVTEGQLSVGFGDTFESADSHARYAVESPLSAMFSKYVAEWQTYLNSLEHLPALASVSGDEGQLAYMSAINLKIMEDKTHAGALIASLSNPWGETAPADTPQTGYKAVWPRDFFQVASAFLAMGDEDTARAAYRYLPKVQVSECHAWQYRRHRLVPAKDTCRWHIGMGCGSARPNGHANHARLAVVAGGCDLRSRRWQAAIRACSSRRLIFLSKVAASDCSGTPSSRHR